MFLVCLCTNMLVLVHSELILFTVSVLGCVLDLCCKGCSQHRDIFIFAEWGLQSRGLFCSSSHQGMGWGWWGFGRGPRQDSWPQGISQTMAGKKKEGEDIWSDGICIPKALLPVMESHWSGWTPPCPWEVVNELFVLLCLLPLFKSLYLSPQVWSLLPLQLSPPSHQGCVTLNHGNTHA